MSVRDAIVIFANGLSLSIATGLIFVMLNQPRRQAINWRFSGFLATLGLWAYFSMSRVVPGMSPFTDTDNFYLLVAGLTLTPMMLFLFVVALCDLDDLPARVLKLWIFVAIPAIAFVLWTDQAFNYRPGGVDEIGFDVHPVGYAVLAHVVVYGVASAWYLRVIDTPQTRRLRLPALILLIGYSTNLVVAVRFLPIDIVMTTIAAGLIGDAVLRWQLFNPLSQANERLRDTNTELRAAITDLAAAKGRLEQLNLELREASRYKNEFLANMSHELRTPLNSIVGYSELLLKGIYGDLSDKQGDRIEKIHRNGLNLLALINDILDLSRIEGGRLELNLGTVRLGAMAESLLATVEPLVGSKKIKLELDLQRPLRLIRADELRIRQVLINLLGNAVKFTHSGTVILATRNVTVKNGSSDDFPLPVTGWLEDRHWLIISVTDTGIGIAQEEQANIFDEFRQVDGTPTRKYEGVGLGLAISKKLVELHTGRIWVTSRLGQGSIFYVAMPALDAFDEHLASAPKAAASAD